mmetsp:Transcript_50108/g.116339  ORF Transcript_50108/g.116339 Transcript_50108/m.116339 type:complete len:250 (-) Transcript_50108:85-834(-)
MLHQPLQQLYAMRSRSHWRHKASSETPSARDKTQQRHAQDATTQCQAKRQTPEDLPDAPLRIPQPTCPTTHEHTICQQQGSLRGRMSPSGRSQNNSLNLEGGSPIAIPKRQGSQARLCTIKLSDPAIDALARELFKETSQAGHQCQVLACAFWRLARGVARSVGHSRHLCCAHLAHARPWKRAPPRRRACAAVHEQRGEEQSTLTTHRISALAVEGAGPHIRFVHCEVDGIHATLFGSALGGRVQARAQ